MEKTILNKEDISQIIFDNKIKKLFGSEELLALHIFYVPKNEKWDVHFSSMGMCGHDLLRLAEDIKEHAEGILKEEDSDTLD